MHENASKPRVGADATAAEDIYPDFFGKKKPVHGK